MTEYLGNHDKSNSQERIARVGYGNLEESSRFWLEGDEKNANYALIGKKI